MLLLHMLETIAFLSEGVPTPVIGTLNVGVGEMLSYMRFQSINTSEFATTYLTLIPRIS